MPGAPRSFLLLVARFLFVPFPHNSNSKPPNFSSAVMLEAIASRLEAIAIRLEAIELRAPKDELHKLDGLAFAILHSDSRFLFLPCA